MTAYRDLSATPGPAPWLPGKLVAAPTQDGHALELGPDVGWTNSLHRMSGFESVLAKGSEYAYVSKAALKAALARPGAPRPEDLGLRFPGRSISAERFPHAAAASNAATLVAVEPRRAHQFEALEGVHVLRYTGMYDHNADDRDPFGGFNVKITWGSGSFVVLLGELFEALLAEAGGLPDRPEPDPLRRHGPGLVLRHLIESITGGAFTLEGMRLASLAGGLAGNSFAGGGLPGIPTAMSAPSTWEGCLVQWEAWLERVFARSEALRAEVDEIVSALERARDGEDSLLALPAFGRAVRVDFPRLPAERFPTRDRPVELARRSYFVIERAESWDPDPAHFGDDEGLAPWRKGKALDAPPAASGSGRSLVVLVLILATAMAVIAYEACR